MSLKIHNLLAHKSGKVITITPDKSLQDAVNLLAQRRIGALVVVSESGNVVGILSERDIIRTAAETREVFSLRVGEAMTRQVVIGMPQDDILSVAHTMTERRFRHLPILDEGKLIGIISIGDVMKAQRDAYQGEIDTLHTTILAE